MTVVIHESYARPDGTIFCRKCGADTREISIKSYNEKPCLFVEKPFQQSTHPTSENLAAKLALLTPEQLSALEVLLTPLTRG